MNTTTETKPTLDDLTLQQVLDHPDWCWDEISSYWGANGEIVLPDHSGFMEEVARIVEMMTGEVFSPAGRELDTFVWDSRKPEVHSTYGTEVCCGCSELIHYDGGCRPSNAVFCDGEGYMCMRCCGADPFAAMEIMAANAYFPTDKCEVDPEVIATYDTLRKLGWRKVTVDEADLKRCVEGFRRKGKRAFASPERIWLTSETKHLPCGPVYRAVPVWFQHEAE